VQRTTFAPIRIRESGSFTPYATSLSLSSNELTNLSCTQLHRLPDLLFPNLRLVFVGTAASTRSAELGHYYAYPGNRFWRAIHEAGITPRRYQPSEFAELIELGIGFTDLSKTGAGMDHQIAAETIDVAGFRAKMETYRPRTIAFTSKKAASLFYGRSSAAIALGRQPRDASLPEVFVLPSPSGAASGHWTIEPWRELGAWIGRAP